MFGRNVSEAAAAAKKAMDHWWELKILRLSTMILDRRVLELARCFSHAISSKIDIICGIFDQTFLLDAKWQPKPETRG
jgi:hypothetical protein